MDRFYGLDLESIVEILYELSDQIGRAQALRDDMVNREFRYLSQGTFDAFEDELLKLWAIHDALERIYEHKIELSELPFFEVDSVDLGTPFDHGAYYPAYLCPYLVALAAGRRRRRRRRATTASVSGTDRTEIVPGKLIVPIAFTTPTTSFAIPLALDSMGPRLVALGNVFQEHRFVSVKVVLHPGFTSGGANRSSYCVAYYKVIPSSPPVTVPNAYSGAVSRYHDVGDTIPVSMTLSKRVLLYGVRPWYINGVPAGSELLDSNQGVLYIVNGSNSVNGLQVNLEISYVVELRGPTLPAVD